MPDRAPWDIAMFFFSDCLYSLKTTKHRSQIHRKTDSRLRCSEGLLITGKKLIGQLCIPRAASLVAANPLKQQMSRSSSFCSKPRPLGWIHYLKKVTPHIFTVGLFNHKCQFSASSTEMSYEYTNNTQEYSYLLNDDDVSPTEKSHKLIPGWYRFRAGH